MTHPTSEGSHGPALPARHARRIHRPPTAAVRIEQEFTFDGADFQRVRRLIHEHAGISLNAGKQAMVYSRLARRLRQTPHRSFAAYLQALQQAERTAQSWPACATGTR